MKRQSSKSPSRALCKKENGKTHVGSFSGTVPDGLVRALLALTLEDVDRFLGRGHVGTLGDVAQAGGDHRLGLVAVDLVLRRRRDRDVDLLDERPRPRALVVLEPARRGEVLEVSALELQVGDLLNELGREALVGLRDERTLRVGKREDDTSELNHLERGVLGNVARSGNERLLALEVFSRCGLLLSRGKTQRVPSVSGRGREIAGKEESLTIISSR